MRSRRRAEPRYQANMELMASLSSALLDLSMQQQVSTQAWSRPCVLARLLARQLDLDLGEARLGPPPVDILEVLRTSSPLVPTCG